MGGRSFRRMNDARRQEGQCVLFRHYSQVSNIGQKVQRALALAHAGKTQRRMVSAAIGTVFVQDSADAARTQWRSIADQLRGKFPKLSMLMDGPRTPCRATARNVWPQAWTTT
jgi:hypothetical protein